MNTTFSCLGFDFSVEAADPALHARITELYSPFTTDVEARAHFALDRFGPDGQTLLTISTGTSCVRIVVEPSAILEHLGWHINQRAIAASPHVLLLHAAAAEHDGTAVLLPAPPRRGKSTLVAGLVAAGFNYLTDDVAPLSLMSGLVEPYPKPIAIHRNTRRLFPQLSPAPPELDCYEGDESYITCRELGATVGGPAVPGLVVLPSFSPGSPNLLTPISAAETLIELTQQSFNLSAFGVHALTSLSAILRNCRCYRLDYSDLTAAVDFISAAIIPSPAIP